MIFKIQDGKVTLEPENVEDEASLARLADKNKYRGRGDKCVRLLPVSIQDGAVELEPASQEDEEALADLVVLTARSEEEFLNMDELACALYRTGYLYRISENVFTTAYCRECSKPLTKYWEVETAVFDGALCDGCAAKCEHVYEKQVSYSRKGLGVSQICQKCNRGMPGGSDLTPEETKQELLDLGIHVV